MDEEEQRAIDKIIRSIDHANATGTPISPEEAFRLLFRGGVAWERAKPMPAAEKIHELAFEMGVRRGAELALDEARKIVRQTKAAARKAKRAKR